MPSSAPPASFPGKSSPSKQIALTAPALQAFGRMTTRDPSETLVEKLRRSRRTLELQIEQGRASCESQDALDRLTELEKKNDAANDSLIQRGEA